MTRVAMRSSWERNRPLLSKRSRKLEDSMRSSSRGTMPPPEIDPAASVEGQRQVAGEGSEEAEELVDGGDAALVAPLRGESRDGRCIVRRRLDPGQRAVGTVEIDDAPRPRGRARTRRDRTTRRRTESRRSSVASLLHSDACPPSLETVHRPVGVGTEAATPSPVPAPRIAIGPPRTRMPPPTRSPGVLGRGAAQSRAPARRSRSGPPAGRGPGRAAGPRSRTTRSGSSGRPNRRRPGRRRRARTRAAASARGRPGRSRSLPGALPPRASERPRERRRPRPDREPSRNGCGCRRCRPANADTERTPRH